MASKVYFTDFCTGTSETLPQKLGGKITFVDAIHYTKGEGIEKKVDDFAAEVAAQIAGATK